MVVATFWSFIDRQMTDHFWHTGPNGRHKCMTFEVMGENLLALVTRLMTRGFHRSWGKTAPQLGSVVFYGKKTPEKMDEKGRPKKWVPP